jgi:uncharacterized protein
MKIGILSDTHGNLAGWQRALELLGDCGVIFHCGDLLYHGPRFDPAPAYNPRALAEAINACPIPLIVVRGNADSEVDALFVRAPLQSPYAFAQIDGQRFLACHGHTDPLEKVLNNARQWEIQFVLSGHLHVPGITCHGEVMHLNPGTTTYPLGEDPALAVPTCAIIENGEARILSLETGEVLLTG